MTPPPVRRLAVIPKRVVGIEVTTNHEIGLGDPQCAHSEVSLVSLSDRRAVDVGDCNTAAPCCLQFDSQGLQSLPVCVPTERLDLTEGDVLPHKC